VAGALAPETCSRKRIYRQMLAEERQARQGKLDGDDKAETVCEDREREPDERCGDAEPSPRRLARHAEKGAEEEK
jgi:hypothetical protein